MDNNGIGRIQYQLVTFPLQSLRHNELDVGLELM